MDNFISTKEAARILKLSRIAVFKKIKTGKIKATKVGRNYILDKQDVLEAAGTLLSKNQKKKIEEAVQKATKDFEKTFRMLGRE